MTKHLVTFIHKPKIVAIVSIAVALCIGVFGYYDIHRLPSYQFVHAGPGSISGSSTGISSTRNLTLGFIAGGRIKSVSVKVGDTVKSGDVLATLDAENASGVLTQAKAAYASAQANYQKILNGATGAAIDVAKASVHTAEINLEQTKKQQDIFVSNAYHALLSSAPQAIPISDQSDFKAPIIGGSYVLDTEGVINLSIYPSNGGKGFKVSGLVDGAGPVTTTTPQPMGNSGLSIVFPDSSTILVPEWTITIPNKNAPNYLTNYNAYQSALQTRTQTIALAEASLSQANASLLALASAARPEDVAQAQAQVDTAYGALEIARASYANTVISAPSDGSINAISIVPGQIAVPNAPAIELVSTVFSKEVPIMIPVKALIDRDGKHYVVKKVARGTEEVEIITGASDTIHVEVLSGLQSSDEVAIH